MLKLSEAKTETSSSRLPATLPPTLLVCPPKLSELKDELERGGIGGMGLEFRNQFGQRVLQIDGGRAKLSYLWKRTSERSEGIMLEGVASEQFYKARSVLYAHCDACV